MAWATRNNSEPTSGFAFRESVSDRLSSEILAAHYGISAEAVHGVLTDDMNEDVFASPSARALYMESAAQLMQLNPTLAAGNPDGATFFERAAAAGSSFTSTAEGAQQFGRYVRLAFASLPNTPALDGALNAGDALRPSVRADPSRAQRVRWFTTRNDIDPAKKRATSSPDAYAVTQLVTLLVSAASQQSAFPEASPLFLRLFPNRS
jgi:hypothetical protein